MVSCGVFWEKASARWRDEGVAEVGEDSGGGWSVAYETDAELVG